MSTGSLGVMSLFDIILIVYGIYSVSAAKKMKKEGRPPQWLVSQQDMMCIRNPRQFCECMAPKTMIFGVLCAVYGIYGLVADLYLKSRMAEGIGIIVFLVCIVWFISELNKAKRKYM